MHLFSSGVPSVYIEVESLPVSAAGKLDRKALPTKTPDRKAVMRSLQLNFETHTVASHAAEAPAQSSSSSASLRKLAKFLRVPNDSSLAEVEDVMMALWESVLVTGGNSSDISLTSNFHEEGGHSLSAARLVAVVNKCFGVRLSAARLFQENFTVENCCIEVLKQWSDEGEEKDDVVESKGSSESDQTEVISRVRNDAILPSEVTFKSSANIKTIKTAHSVFLTGATGYLGAHILAQVLTTNDIASVTCLVRSGDPDAVRNNCEKYGLKIDYSRVILERGDLSLSHFGMNNADWNRVSGGIDFIIHCGAMVSLTAPYDGKMRDINVGGTREAIKLASACQEGTALVYVSSNGIFPSCDELFLENDVVSCLPDRLGPSNGYGK